MRGDGKTRMTAAGFKGGAGQTPGVEARDTGLKTSLGQGAPLDAGVAPVEQEEEILADFCVLGAGAAGIAAALTAARAGLKTVLVERRRMGGAFLEHAVPSKALFAAARRARMVDTAAPFGIRTPPAHPDMRAIQVHLAQVHASVAPNSSSERLTGLGVRVIQAAAEFTGRRIVQAGPYRIRARHFVIAAGASPTIPPVPGLETVPYFTAASIIGNAEPLGHLLVAGGDPEGIEIAQAYRRLGSRVTVLCGGKILEGVDPELSAPLLAALRAEGIAFREDAVVERAEGAPGQVRLHISAPGGIEAVEGTHVLLAAGRTPNTAGLGLDAAGIVHGKNGIRVNRGLRTSNRRVFAIGSIADAPHAAYAAQHQAAVAVQSALTWGFARMNPRLVPRTLFTDPELAEVGLGEQEVRQKMRRFGVLRWPYCENARAQAERQTAGHIKVITAKDGRILGAGITGANAGELIHIWALAVSQGLNIRAFSEYIPPQPTLSEIHAFAAHRFQAGMPAGSWLNKVISSLVRS